MSSSAEAALDEIRLAMSSTNELFNAEVFGKRNFAAIDDIYTEDARILPPGAAMISGRAAIKEFWSKLIEAVNGKSAVLTPGEVMPTGDGAVEIGQVLLTLAPAGQETSMEAKYVVYWRQEEGRWKWHVDIWNLNQ